MRMRPRSALFLASLAVLGTVLAGCQAAPSQPSTAPSTAESTEDTTAQPDTTTTHRTDLPRPPGCDLAPAALIKATLGMSLREPTQSFDDTEIDCTYVPVQEDGLTILLRFRLGQDHASFVTYRTESETSTGLPAIDVAGLGDEAFYSRGEFGITVTYTVVARKGAVVVVVGAPTSLDSVQNLVQQILAALA